jgi:hypothetical protein
MLLRVGSRGLFSWLFLNFSRLLLFSPSIPLFLPSLVSEASSAAPLSPTRWGISSSTNSLRNSWAMRAEGIVWKGSMAAPVYLS